MNTDDFYLQDKTHWRLFSPENAQKDWVVLWLQGFHSTIEGHSEGCARMSTESGVTFAMLNYAGHGDHPVALEDATRQQQFDEVCAVYDELTQRGFTKIIVVGGSFGGYMAALLAGARVPKVIALRAPANYKDEEFSTPYQDTTESKDGEAKDLYRQSISEDYSNNAIEALRTFEGVTYVIEHEKDTVIESNIPKSYYAAARHGNYIVIPGLKHSPKLMEDPQHYVDIVERWLQTIIYVSTRNKD